MQDVLVVRGAQGHGIVVLGALDDLGQRGEVHAERHRPVAAVFKERFGVELDGDQRDVTVVHRLQFLRDTRVGRDAGRGEGGREVASAKANNTARARQRASTYQALFVALKVRVRYQFLDGCMTRRPRARGEVSIWAWRDVGI